ncbi:MAG: glucosamine-6-phosphate isomerase [Ruminococcaceae bacterium]|nr:glucosamine-6-phosphate isomerase [Oscillospiraceae bacterium]
MNINPINLIPANELGRDSKIKLSICDTEHDLYWRMAIEVLECIKANNEKGEDTIMVVPYGPLGPYARLGYLVNTYRVSLKRCTFINMDEYLNDDLTYIDKDDPLSFRGGMERIFYNLIDDELNVLPENRHFPIPGEEGKVLELIEKAGKLDMAWGGVGINGHFAFNEPPEPGEACTAEEFLDRPTRTLPISRETKTINCFMNCGGDLEAIPKFCITVGMKEMFMAKKVRMCMPRDWNAGALRKILHGGETPAVPCSLFARHPDAMIYCSRIATESPVPEIRIYNK